MADDDQQLSVAVYAGSFDWHAGTAAIRAVRLGVSCVVGVVLYAVVLVLCGVRPSMFGTPSRL